MKAPAQGRLVGDLRTIGFACLGGLLGYYGFVYLLGRGYYALVLPGGFVGLVAGIPRSRSLIAPVLCSVLALGAGLLAEHRFAPFAADPSLSFFLRHALELRPMTLLFIGVGGLIGFWVPFRRRV